MKLKLDFYPGVTPLRDLIDELEKDKVIDPESYEISVKSEKVVLLLRLRPDREFVIYQLAVNDNNEVVKPSQQYFIIKLTFKTENGSLIVPESGVLICPSLVSAFPELSNLKFSEEMLVKKPLNEIIRTLKETIIAEVSNFYQAWRRRGSLLMRLHDIFSNNGALVTVDLVTMMKLQIGFQFSSSLGNYVLEMDLASDFPKSVPKFSFYQKDGEETLVHPITTGAAKMTSNMSNDEIVNKTISLMEALSEKLE